MNPVPLDPFDDESFDDEAMKEHFLSAMDPFWNLLHESLEGQKPSDWGGYHCEIDVVWDPDSKKYLISASFRDATSNRAKRLVSRRVLELVRALHEAHGKFDAKLEWRKVSLSDFWDQAAQRRCRRISWEWGRQVLKSEPGVDGLN